MKTKFLLFMIALISQSLYAQQKIIVTDATDLQPVADVMIKFKGDYVRSNEKGIAIIHAEKGDSVRISHPLYFTEIIVIDNSKSEYKVELYPQVIKLDEFVISANKSEEKKSDVPQQVMIMQSRDLQNMNAQTSADVLQQSGNVLVQKSQQGGGSPIIRGFEANRVLIVIDGVRMNNAIYRGGHLQSVLRLDNNMLDRLELVMGPGSTMYGSDALGGVMHFHSRKPVFATSENDYISGNSFYRLGTANHESTGHIDFNLGYKKIAFLTSVTYSQFEDLWSGKNKNPFYNGNWDRNHFVEIIDGKDYTVSNSDPSLQKGTGYNQYDFLQKIAIKLSDSLLLTFNFQFSNSGNVPRYDRLTQYSGSNLKFAEWYYGPEKRLLAAAHLVHTAKTKLYDKLTFTLSMQDLQESRITRRFQQVYKTTQTEDVTIYAANLDLSKEKNKHEMRYGTEFTFNNVNSSAVTKDIDADTSSASITRYPDGGSTLMTTAAYFSHSWEISEKFILTDGIRFNYVSLHSEFKDTSLMHFPFTSAGQSNFSLNGNLGFIFKPAKDWKFSLLASTGFRAPNVDDMGKTYESVPGKIIVPNPDLTPEYTYNGDFTIEKSFSGKVVISATGFYTYITDIISVQKFQFNGEDSIVVDGTLSEVNAAQNYDKGYVTGYNISLAADITENFSITSSLNYTYGRIITDTIDYPLDHIAPVFGKTSFVLQLNKFRNEFFVAYNGWKHVWDYSMNGEDNFAASTVYGTPAWYTLNFRTSFTVNKNFRLQASVENILDRNYRIFASGVNAPGRNFSLTVRAGF